MENAMSPRILNIADIELKSRPPELAPSGPAATVFDARMGAIGQRLGAQKLGYNITAVPIGKAAFPFHCHRVNEEMFFIIQGSGEIRIGVETHQIGEGDVIACPPGGPDTAHQIKNTGSTELRYLAVSTNLTPDIALYPDSGKFGVLAQFPADSSPRKFSFIGRENQSGNYWEGEGEKKAGQETHK
jgi:uncharacterized cupin superfamily protein